MSPYNFLPNKKSIKLDWTHAPAELRERWASILASFFRPAGQNFFIAKPLKRSNICSAFQKSWALDWAYGLSLLCGLCLKRTTIKIFKYGERWPASRRAIMCVCCAGIEWIDRKRYFRILLGPPQYFGMAWASSASVQNCSFFMVMLHSEVAKQWQEKNPQSVHFPLHCLA